MLFATCMWGATFALALAAISKAGEDAGALVGRVYAANTVGAASHTITSVRVSTALIVARPGTRVGAYMVGGAIAVEP